ncbi:Protein of unknown function [Halomicrobium zhouii]|uniref:DUF6884 domain-containing protein n=1 Tax=Halomicrobium zhouii TaxID=767519 RepID=A0A1I6L0E8_9EURY|nr:DUF6884 domain-containing protein [Halomicrobium zhouii]SFR96943.1 Protein of unknown function [Halomicrobium zhouii]
MSTLLVQSCSKSKNQARSPGPAFDIYSGYYYKILKKAIDDGAFVDWLDVCILSAKYGILDRNEEIEVYDRRMDRARAAELRPEVTDALAERVATGGYDTIVVNAGKTYQQAIEDESIPIPVQYIDGDGLGKKGQALKRFVRGKDAARIEGS